MDHYNKDIDNKIKISSRFMMPSPIFIIYNNSGKEKDDWEGEKEEDWNRQDIREYPEYQNFRVDKL